MKYDEEVYEFLADNALLKEALEMAIKVETLSEAGGDLFFIDVADMIRILADALEKYKKMYFEESFKNKQFQDIIKLEQNK